MCVLCIFVVLVTQKKRRRQKLIALSLKIATEISEMSAAVKFVKKGYVDLHTNG